MPESAAVRRIPVDSKDQAKKVIENHVRYLRLLFEQSRDPYYGTPKWSDECLKANEIGESAAAGAALLSVSNLILDSKSQPGHCKGVSHTVVMLYCDGQKEVQEIKIPNPPPAGFGPRGLCP